MHTTVFSGAIVGIDGLVIEVEVDIARGIPAFSVVGLPNAAVREARERVTSAIKNSGCDFPLERITVNLAPADVKKEGAAHDLAIAIGILLASGQVEPTSPRTLFIGELALDGSLRRVPGVLPILLHARERGFGRAIIPLANLEEARVVEGVEVVACETLRAAMGLEGRAVVKRADEPVPPPVAPIASSAFDMADVVGQEAVKRALLIAAAGGHHVLMVGPPGSGKTMLARRFATILPPLSPARSMETTMIYSIVGLLHHVSPRGGLVTHAPFRAPHHSASDAGLIGGTGSPRPGEITLAHNGVLFLDELPEFRRHVLETLREPLEEGHITISRAKSSVTFPTRFQLVAAMNPWRSVAILSLAYYVLETGLPGRSEVSRRAREEAEARSKLQPAGSGALAGREHLDIAELGKRQDRASCPLLPGYCSFSGLQPAPKAGRQLPGAPKGGAESQRAIVEATGKGVGGPGDDGSRLGEWDPQADEVTLRPTLPLLGSVIVRCIAKDRAYRIESRAAVQREKP